MPAVLITGASTGIGEACALHLDRLGHRVFAGVRKENDADRLRRAASDRLRPMTLDVTDSAQIADTFAEMRGQVGAAGLQGVVNNAGVALGGPLEFLELDVWRDQLEVNVVGQVAITRAALPLLRPSRGRVVFVGSVSGLIATPFMGPYGASKHAIEAVAESLRQELRPWNMHVAVIEPGATRTAIWEKGRNFTDHIEQTLPPEALELYPAAIAMAHRNITEGERTGISPQRIADAVEHALFHRRPRLRYPVGPDAKLVAALVRVLPDRVRAALLAKMGVEGMNSPEAR